MCVRECVNEECEWEIVCVNRENGKKERREIMEWVRRCEKKKRKNDVDGTGSRCIFPFMILLFRYFLVFFSFFFTLSTLLSLSIYLSISLPRSLPTLYLSLSLSLSLFSRHSPYLQLGHRLRLLQGRRVLDAPLLTQVQQYRLEENWESNGRESRRERERESARLSAGDCGVRETKGKRRKGKRNGVARERERKRVRM